MIAVLDIYNEVKKLIKKDGLSGYFDLDEFNKWIPRVENTLMSYYCEILELSSEVSDSLRPFTMDTQINLSSGYAAFPSDYRHFTEVRYNYYLNATTCGGVATTKPLSCDFLQSNKWGDMLNSAIRKPNAAKGKVRYRFVNNQIQVSEQNGSIFLTYIRHPIHPVVTYTVNVTTEEYEPTNAPNFEWLEQDRSDLVDLFCMNLGMSIRETALIQWASMPKKAMK